MLKKCPACDDGIPIEQCLIGLGHPFHCNKCKSEILIENNNKKTLVLIVLVSIINLRLSDSYLSYIIFTCIFIYAIYLYIYKNTPITLSDFLKKYPNSKITKNNPDL